MVMTYPTVMTNMLPVTGAWPCAISKCKATSVPYSKATSKTLIRSGSSINGKKPPPPRERRQSQK
jgi:hypothetical protein